MHMKAVSTRLRRYGQISLSKSLFFSISICVCWGVNLFFVDSDSDSDSGLRYDDTYDQYYHMDIKEALNRLPREVVDARNQRLKRAMDLSMKHEYLPKDLQVLIWVCDDESLDYTVPKYIFSREKKIELIIHNK